MVKQRKAREIIIVAEPLSPVFELIRQLYAAMNEKGHSVAPANKRGDGYHEVYAAGRIVVGCYTRCKQCGMIGKNTYADGLTHQAVREHCTGMKPLDAKLSRGQVQRGKKSD